MTQTTEWIPIFLVLHLLLAGWLLWKLRRDDLQSSEKIEDIRQRCARVQVMEFAAFTFFFVTFWWVSKVAALLSLAIYLACSFSLSYLQYQAEGRLQKDLVSGKERVQLEIRGQGYALLMLLCYFATVFSVIAGFTLISKILPLNDSLKFAVVAVGITLGLLSGMWIMRGLYPRFLARMIPSRLWRAEEGSAEVSKLFTEHQLPEPELRILLTERLGVHNALVCGYPRGRGIFRPGLFITDKLLNELSPAELMAVMKHEISHLLLKHAQQRMKVSLKSFAASALMLAGVVSAVLLFFNPILLLPVVSFGFILPIMMQLSALKKLMHQQEYAADFHAVFVLGASISDLEGALRKIDAWNGHSAQTEQGSSMSHPGTSQRVRRLVRAAHRPDAISSLEAWEEGIDRDQDEAA